MSSFFLPSFYFIDGIEEYIKKEQHCAALIESFSNELWTTNPTSMVIRSPPPPLLLLLSYLHLWHAVFHYFDQRTYNTTSNDDKSTNENTDTTDIPTYRSC
mmetsp:Transcript_41029/g.65982  ORF Transcript_41029/g.65982 Transcript_41029/m.65982 type:complete len:101 (-) Transcript_41029:12-314(-)